ncbi:hypothetical protein BX600DRAFT_528062, partial [Xylariales sp. PMI_506]
YYSDDSDDDDDDDDDGLFVRSDRDDKPKPSVYFRNGIKWRRTGVNLLPHWIGEPNIRDIIMTLRDAISPNKGYQVELIHTSQHSKFYSITSDRDLYVLKLMMPLCERGVKTRCEVATMNWTRHFTSLPLPHVVHFSTSRDSPVGCEWILMTKVPGQPLAQCWNKMPFGVKERIVRQLARYAHEVFSQPIESIGNASTRTAPVLMVSEMAEWHREELAAMAASWGPARIGAIPCLGKKASSWALEDSCTGPTATADEWALRRIHIAHVTITDWTEEPGYEAIGPERKAVVERMLDMTRPYGRLWRIYYHIFRPEIVLMQTRDSANESDPEDRSELGSEKDTHEQGVIASGAGQKDEDEGIEAEADNGDLEDGSVNSVVATGTSQQEDTEEIADASIPPPPPPPSPNANETVIKDEEIRETIETSPKIEADNLMVDDAGVLTGVLGWEACTTVPSADPPGLWSPSAVAESSSSSSSSSGLRSSFVTAPTAAEAGVSTTALLPLPAVCCDVPALLKQGRFRSREPRVGDFVDYAGRRVRRNYWRARREWETTKLRALFGREMLWYHNQEQDNQPHDDPNSSGNSSSSSSSSDNSVSSNRDEQPHDRPSSPVPAPPSLSWVQTWAAGQAHRDMEAAVRHCSDEAVFGLVEAWCDQVEAVLAEVKGADWAEQQEGQQHHHHGQSSDEVKKMEEVYRQLRAKLRAPRVASLAEMVTAGPDWRAWDD